MGWGLNYSMSDYITNTAAGDNANKAWYHEAVVDQFKYQLDTFFNKKVINA